MTEITDIRNASTKINPVMIRLARESRGLWKHQLARKIGVTTATITGFETGRICPTEGELEDMGEVLDYPVGFFSRQDRIDGRDLWFSCPRARGEL